MPVGPALTLTVDGPSGARELRLRVGQDPVAHAVHTIDEAELVEINLALRGTLERIHDVAGNSLDLAADHSAEVVDQLVGVAGAAVAYGVFHGRALGLLYDSARLVAPGALAASVPPRVVEVVAPAEVSVPLELLPWQVAPDGVTDAATRARCLLGMSALVRRRLPREQASSVAELVGDPLDVSMFQHDALTATVDELAFLHGRPDVELDGPWPGSAALTVDAVARHMLDTRQRLDGTVGRPAAVLHLACHCDTREAYSGDHALDVGGTVGPVTLARLRAQSLTTDLDVPGPLVVLNACGSSVPQPTSRAAFVRFFLQQRFAGVVGTLCDISDAVAAHFAVVFYDALLRGRTVGEAMYDARWHLMEHHGNPLGLLYTLHGDPDLRVSRPSSRQSAPACTARAVAP